MKQQGKSHQERMYMFCWDQLSLLQQHGSSAAPRRPLVLLPFVGGYLPARQLEMYSQRLLIMVPPPRWELSQSLNGLVFVGCIHSSC